MDNFTFYAPTYYVFGTDAERETGRYVRRFGGTRVLIHYGGGSALRSGVIDRVCLSLEQEGITYLMLGGVMPNPRSGLVYEGIRLCREEGVDFILAVGGGSVIDSAKAIAAGVLYRGDFWDLYQGGFTDRALPVGTVLTISAAGSEGSANSVITKEEGMFKRRTTGEALRPKFSILNPDLTFSVSPYQTACGITDILAHLYERYLTNTEDVEVTDRMIEGLMLAMIHEGPRVMEDPEDYGARANIMWAGTMAHNNSCGVGRTQDWNSHSIEHELSALYDCAHGAGLAVVLPAVLTYCLPHDVMRLARLAERVWGCRIDPGQPAAAAEEGIRRFRQFLHGIGMPGTFAELGAKEEDIPYLAHVCCWGDGRKGTLDGYVRLNEEDVDRIYRMML